MRRLASVILVLVLAAAIPAGLREAPAPAAIASLRDALDEVVTKPGWQDDRWSVLAVSLDRGDTLYALTPDQALAPASSLKLMTTAAALRWLGPDYRYTTYLMTDGTIANGVLTGNVYLYGTGDPTLGTRFAPAAAPALKAFADTLLALGVKEIRGDVVGDGSYFQGASTAEGWELDYLNAWYAPAAGALSVHENLVRLEITAGEGAGAPARIRYIPGGAGISLQNRAVTGGGTAINVTRQDYGAPIQVTGRVSGGTVARAIPVSDPTMYATAVFRDVLVEKGIVHTGGIRAIEREEDSPVTGKSSFAPRYDERPAPRVVAVHRSEPLREILKTINHVSHNFYAEQVARTVGRVATGEGSLRGSAAAVESLLAEAGADTSKVSIVDGCGLSPLNRVDARSFVALLDWVAKSPYASEFEGTMAVAGETRRFRRMGGTPAAGNLRAKTGTIDHVSALAGYVNAANGEKIAFSIISNDVPSVGQAKFIENMIGAQLASFDRAGAAPVARATEAPSVAQAEPRR